MSAFILFWGDMYYPGGGAIDYHTVIETQSEDFAIRLSQKHLESSATGDWAHLSILDGKQLNVIAEWESEGRPWQRIAVPS